MSEFQQGDIVRVSTKPEHDLPEADSNLPEEWDAIVVSVDDDGDPEVAWLSRSSTALKRQAPVKETWDTSTVRIQPEYGAHVKLLRRATYEEVNIGG